MILRPQPAILLLVGAVGLGASVRGLSPEPEHASAQQPVLRSTQLETQQGRQGREFYFTRAMYSGYGRRYASWSVDFPKADVQFLFGVRRLTNIDAYEFENPVRLDDPNLRRFPFLYALEVGRMALSPAEIQGLRGYLMAGGFLVIDDFWDMDEWQNFEYEISQVLPEYRIVDIPMDHPLLSAFYEIDEILQVPNRSLGAAGGRTWECWNPCDPALRGIFDEHNRLMVVINWNTDLGDAWEWVEQPWYPWKYSNFAYKLGVNMIIYGMSH